MKWAALGIIPLLLLGSPAFAHHPFGMGDSSQLTGWTGLISGIGHPLLGPDHLLFLLAIAFIGLKRPTAWILPMLAIGLGGSLDALHLKPRTPHQRRCRARPEQRLEISLVADFRRQLPERVDFLAEQPILDRGSGPGGGAETATQKPHDGTSLCHL